jgi:hypothetical protein
MRSAPMLLEHGYVPYGGYADIGNYHGTVLGVSLDTQLGSWVTLAQVWNLESRWIAVTARVSSS